ncbi:MAG: FMN-binding protein [Oscillospiraceae bacterium]|nr:FMN-binding protein [Oscillospiraceae bacterium]
MKMIQSFGVRLLPALLVIALMIGCASMPELADIPERLTLTEVSAEEQKTDSEESNPAAEADEEADTEEEPVQAVGNYTDGVYTGTGTGYGGEIEVQVTVENGQITAIEILSHAGETESFFNRAIAVVDSILLSQSWEVDAVSGATYSSNGIKNAVKNALTGEVTETETADTSGSGNSAALTTVAYTDPSGYADGTYTGSAAGYGGTITVSVTVSGGVITSITVVSTSGETSSYLAKAQGVISSILSAQSPNVDAVSGATYSSNGIINATKAALKQAAAEDGEGQTSSAEDETTPSVDFTTLPNYGYTDGTYTGTGLGYGGDVTMTVVVSGGQITSVTTVSAENETYAYWTQAVTLTDTIVQAQTWEVDVVSGATFSSEGILEAVQNALAEALPDTDSTDDEETETPAPSDDEEEPESPAPSDNEEQDEPETTVTTTTETCTGTATVYPDEDEDFDAYTVSVTLTVQTVVTTVTENGTVTTTTVRTLSGAEYSADTDSINLRYLSRAWNGMSEGLTAGEAVDAVSGATCSSKGIQEAWDSAMACAALGTTVTTESKDDEAADDAGDASQDEAATTGSGTEDAMLPEDEKEEEP